ncbi:NFACT family protein [Altericista sp. CCNU0014]|uniref:Rqc2 family fibronectin-binding protein n=1 Tax=Altericista sp. CCNU0014 TaxID=3082949 RepID=UPI00384F624F
MQQVDLTTLIALKSELRAQWIPARLEQVYQCDRFTVKLALRTLKKRGWLALSWHPQAARIGMGEAPPRSPDTFTFSQQLVHQLNGFALVAIEQIAPWERVIDLQFAQRPQEPPQWHLYVEIMGKYSNVILTTADRLVVTAAHQVGTNQSRVRSIQTGRPYELPPGLTGPTPALEETQEAWRDRLTLIPGPLKSTILKVYRGLSSALVLEILAKANLDPAQGTDTLTESSWDTLFQTWQSWLATLASESFRPGWRADGGFTVLGWDVIRPATSVQDLVDRYYTAQLDRQSFEQLRHQLLQKLSHALAKLQVKAEVFSNQMAASDRADRYRQQADLLMAHLHLWQLGMSQIVLPDFETEQPVTIPLNPERNAVQNAQVFYRRHQKLRRSRDHVKPLLEAVRQEIDYLLQVEATIEALEQFDSEDDLQILAEIREELIQQKYLSDPDYRAPIEARPDFYRYTAPSGGEILIGRNNQQNEQLSFKIAGAYDLWFHTQEIPGSHVLLRLDAGTAVEPQDLQHAANLAAYYSRARQSTQVPVVWTEPKNVYKPKGAKPGMVVYKHERVIWGNPQNVSAHLHAREPSDLSDDKIQHPSVKR